MNKTVKEKKETEAPALVKRIGKTTYIVNVHFSDTAWGDSRGQAEKDYCF